MRQTTTTNFLHRQRMWDIRLGRRLLRACGRNQIPYIRYGPTCIARSGLTIYS